jgi:hypothetical protein
LCTTGGQAFVTWYDRRAATPCPTPPCPGINNDLTDYFAGSARLDAGGNLVAGTDFRISEVADPWCASGWPCGTRQAPDASESCSIQPQLAGFCTDAMGNFTGIRCDFLDCGGVGQNMGGACQCTAGAVCNGGNGCPKYGDYNGNACTARRLFAAWASATSPPGITPPSTTIDIFFSSRCVVDPIAGDLDCDGDVDCNDLAIVRASFGKRSGQLGFDPLADTNSDGVVDVKDLAFVAQKLPVGTRCP